MNRGIELELSILRTITDAKRLPKALRLAMAERPWLVEESGLRLNGCPSRSNRGILSLSTAILLVALPSLTYAQQFMSYTVQPGDTLSTIATRQFGSSELWKEIWRLNPDIRDAALIFPGQKLRIGPPPERIEAKSGVAVRPLVGPQALVVQEQSSAKELRLPVKRDNPLSLFILRLLDLILFILLIFRVHHLWLDWRRSTKKTFKSKIRRAKKPVVLWEPWPARQESCNFIAGR